jgi:hypothetical protein
MTVTILDTSFGALLGTELVGVHPELPVPSLINAHLCPGADGRHLAGNLDFLVA